MQTLKHRTAIPFLLALATFSCTNTTTDNPDDDQRTRWTMVEEMRIGSGGGPEQFGQLKGLAVFADGRFAVLDSQAREIRVFDADGSHVATHGRRGEGPGEMEFPNGLMHGPRDLLWVPDPSNARMSAFHPDSGFVTSFPYRTGLTEWAWSGAIGADGRIFAKTLSDDRAELLVVFDSAMVATDTLPLEAESTWGEDSYCWTTAQGGSSCQSVPFYPTDVRFIDPDGYVWQRATGIAEYRITKWMPGGDTVLVVTGDREPLPVTSEEREAAIADVREYAGGQGGQTNFDWSLIPGVKAIVMDLFTSKEGNLWVRFRTPDGKFAYDVWSPEGTLLGTTTTDIRIHTNEATPVVRGDAVWLVANDDMGTDYVVRARLTEAGG